MSDVWVGPGYWLASDGKWYAPELHPSRSEPGPEVVPGPGEGLPADAPSRYAPHNGLRSGTDSLGPASVTDQWTPWSEQVAGSPGIGPPAGLFAAGPPGPEDRPATRRVRRRIVAGVVGALVVVGVAVGIVVAMSGQPTRWDPKVLGIVHFVELHRGLTFKHAVKVEFLGNSDFNKEVSVPVPTSKSDRAELGRALGEFRALGLVHGNVNLAASENTLNQADVVGLYVNDKKTVFVRGTRLTPYVRVTLAHELTHALQDQYFDLTDLDNKAEGGDDDAVTALVEGDAVRVQNAYEETLSAADKKSYLKAQERVQKGSSKASGVPEILSDLLSFPYAFGPTFVDALDARDGTAGIDRAFRNPPVNEAQIVDPVQYPLGWKRTPVRPPVLKAEERRLDKPSSFGQFSLFEVLGSRLGYDTAWAAVQGWQGDNSVPYSDHGRTCIAVDVALKTTGSTAPSTQAAEQWAQGIPGATVTGTGRLVDLRSCDPGPKAAAPPTIRPSAFDVLSARSEIIDALVTSDHADFALGSCVADHVFAGVGTSHYSELTTDDLSAAQEAQLRQLVVSSAGSCESAGVR